MCLRLIKRLLLVGVLLGCSLGGSTWWVHRQTKQVPEFYEHAIASPMPPNLSQSSDELEANVQQLQADATRVGQWQASFAIEQINAWLIEQLPIRFPTLEAKGLQDPRVMIEDGVVTAAARYKNQRFDAVVSCQLSVRLTDQPNRLAISVGKIRAGALPLPLSQFQDRIKRIAFNTNLNLNWESNDGETIALIDVPKNYPGHLGDPVVIESITLADQQLVVAGRTGDLQPSRFEPRGPVYKLASRVEGKSSEDVVSVRNVHREGDLPDSELK